MKKLLLLTSMLLLTLSASAATPLSISFINGSGVYVTNNATVAFADTNVVFTNVFGTRIQSTNIAHFVDVPLFSDKDGKIPPLSVTLKYTGNNANSSNVLTCKFRFSGNGTDFDTFTDYEWSFVQTPVGTTSGTLTTNVPAVFVDGKRKMRIHSIAASNVSNATNVVINSLQLNGHVP